MMLLSRLNRVMFLSESNILSFCIKLLLRLLLLLMMIMRSLVLIIELRLLEFRAGAPDILGSSWIGRWTTAATISAPTGLVVVSTFFLFSSLNRCWLGSMNTCRQEGKN